MKKTTRQPRKRIIRPKDCFFCKQKLTPDYKDLETLKKVISERGKIISRMYSGVCQKHQRKVSETIKRARFLAILPYIVRPS